MDCLLYARVSTEKQAQKELSIPAQIEAMRECAVRNGWRVSGHFIDRGESARTANRPELKRLLEHCRESKGIDIVMVHKIDRLARNLVDYATIKAILKKKGIRLVSVSEPFDDNSIGYLLENIIASISEWYSANLGDEIRKSHMAKLKRGEWPIKPPLGYKSVKGEDNRAIHVPDEEKAMLVRQAYEIFSAGNYSLKALAEEMTLRGLTTRRGKRYSEENIRLILKRRFYIGQIVWLGKVYAGKHEPIVPKDLFYRVQRVLQKRSVDVGEKGRQRFLLRGVAYCRSCNLRMTGEHHPRGSYYRCFNAIGGDRCTERYTPMKSLDDELATLYRRLKPSNEFLELLRAEMHNLIDLRRQTAQREVGLLKRTINETEVKETRLLDEMLDDRIPRYAYDRLAKTYREKREQAEGRLAQLQVNYDNPLAFLDQCMTIAGMLTELHNRFTFEQRKDLIRAIFRRIDVQDRAIVGVKLNPPFSFLFEENVRQLYPQPLNERHSSNAEGIKDNMAEKLASFTVSDEYVDQRDTMAPLLKAVEKSHRRRHSR